MLSCQKDKFSIPEHVSYLNCAYFSPLLNHVEAIGHEAVSKKRMPYEITIDDFFNPVEKLKKLFAQLIGEDNHERISLIPGVSYGIENVANNISLVENDNIIVVGEQFPSNIYPWTRILDKANAKLVTINPSREDGGRGKSWNKNILNAINERTKLIAIANVHWADGTLYDLKAIRRQCDKYNALLVIDGSQSAGALPFSVKEIRPDALVCAGYKWLLGPYSLGLAYYGDKFDHGEPIEQCWINKVDSEDFQNLAKYKDHYKPNASRYNVSESSNFILVPMLSAAIEQILKWTPEGIQQYCKDISDESLDQLAEIGCTVEEEEHRANHLFGIRLDDQFDLHNIKKSMQQKDVFVSFRGNAIRVAPHVYNTKNDFEKLVSSIKEGKKRAIY